ncbi:phosphatase PAP2 family protein [Geomonas sp. RF6]|uniref:phosphatase PAP2 family protein n=1 Tax=Geomonas sp. RF6 TaxID=2897342 RepID=UPI001E5C6AFB|nr:phosphatase PAP2 family protein [Geomonas sp. RF6]UFS70073.1 phosphatase PAP2 family protein [Geomonas sp. RF6]
MALLIGSLGTLPAHAAQTQVAAQEKGNEVVAATEGRAAATATVDEGAAASLSATDMETAPSTSDLYRINGKYLKGVITDAGGVITSPLHWDARDWAKAGAVVGITSGLFLADRSIRDFAQSNQNSVANGLAKVGNAFGDPLYAPAMVGSFYLYGVFGDDMKARRTSLLALESYAISSVLTGGIKNLSGRHRPETGDGPMTFDGPAWKVKNGSFVSGHTSNAFAIATVFANEYADNRYVPPIAYGLATLTAFARVYDNKHWASDVFFGGALGYFTGKAILSFHKKDNDPLLGRLTIAPQVTKEMTGLTVGYNF